MSPATGSKKPRRPPVKTERQGKSARVVRVPDAKVALSTASVYPESTAAAFEIAGRLGYDGVEVMVMTDQVSQDPDALKRLSDHYAMPILAVHAPCLLVTQRVWGTDPWGKLVRARAAAEKLGAATVVVHPPFRWQREYSRGLRPGAATHGRRDRHPLRGREHVPVARPVPRGRGVFAGLGRPAGDYPHTTLDLSHTAVSQSDPLRMADDLGDRLAHIHLADGSGSARDEHLIPGRGSQPCGPLARAAGPASSSPARSSSRSPHARRRHAPSARRTSPRPSHSPACTWPSRRRKGEGGAWCPTLP